MKRQALDWKENFLIFIYDKGHMTKTVCWSQPVDNQYFGWTSPCGSYDWRHPSATTIRKFWKKKTWGLRLIRSGNDTSHLGPHSKVKGRDAPQFPQIPLICPCFFGLRGSHTQPRGLIRWRRMGKLAGFPSEIPTSTGRSWVLELGEAVPHGRVHVWPCSWVSRLQCTGHHFHTSSLTLDWKSRIHSESYPFT